jgi:hypothetical protein
VGTWHDPDLGRPIAAPLERCAELLGVDLATICEAAANVAPYICADGAKVWSLMRLERQLRPARTVGGEAATSTVAEFDPPTHSSTTGDLAASRNSPLILLRALG